MPTTPPLEALYDAWPIWPSKAATLARLTIAPRWPSSSGSLRLITVAACRTMSKVPTRLMAITFLNASRSWADSSCPSRPMVRWAQPMPAEFTTARSGAISAAALTAAVICSVFGHVDQGEDAVDLGGERLTLVGLEVGDHDGRALAGELTRRPRRRCRTRRR